MVIDTSALVAIVMREPDGAVFDERIRSASVRRMSVGNGVELMIVLSNRLAMDASVLVERVLSEYAIELVVVDSRQMSLAFEGASRFGKGRHPAALNYGDCFAYGLARALGEPLLFKGGDFSRTDIAPAL
jgi:ribonuclease VapC